MSGMRFPPSSIDGDYWWLCTYAHRTGEDKNVYVFITDDWFKVRTLLNGYIPDVKPDFSFHRSKFNRIIQFISEKHKRIGAGSYGCDRTVKIHRNEADPTELKLLIQAELL